MTNSVNKSIVADILAIPNTTLSTELVINENSSINVKLLSDDKRYGKIVLADIELSLENLTTRKDLGELIVSELITKGVTKSIADLFDENLMNCVDIFEIDPERLSYEKSEFMNHLKELRTELIEYIDEMNISMYEVKEWWMKSLTE